MRIRIHPVFCLWGSLCTFGAGSVLGACEPQDSGACESDVDCKGDRVCDRGVCVSDGGDGDDASPATMGPGDGDGDGDGEDTGDGDGDSGLTGDGDGESSGDGDGDCADATQSCSAQECCGGSTCVNFGEGVVECAADCTTGGDCAGSCCVPLESEGAVCVTGWCGSDTGPGCAATSSLCENNGGCCGYDEGSAYCVNLPDEGGAFCSAACDSGADCVSGCCAGLNNGGSACVPAYVCGGEVPEDVPAAEIRRGLTATPEAGPAESWAAAPADASVELAPTR